MLKIAICDDESYYLKLVHSIITKLLYERGISEYDIDLFSSGEDLCKKNDEMTAIRFLLKDMLEEMLPECIDTIIKKLYLQALRIKYNFVEGEKEIFIDKIYYVESWKHKLTFSVWDKELIQYSLYNKLDDIE